MEFRISETFTTSLARLQGDEQRAVKTTAFDLQVDPSAPGLQFHRLDRARDKNFWSVRVNRDIRLIVHRTAESLLLCYVAHHDDAYNWAERRKLEAHPTTGAAQIVEIRETIVEIPIERYVEVTPTSAPTPEKPKLFEGRSKEELLGYGVPPEWLKDVLEANEDTLFDLTDHLPGEAAEALLELATGGQPRVATSAPPSADPFQHPDAQRRFRTIDNIEELERALDYPWDRWTIFLHPSQRAMVEHTYNGPARVAGSAGTGKTVVALHRAVHLARQDEEALVLLTTFSDALANLLRSRLFLLIKHEPKLAERITVESMQAVGENLYRAQFGSTKIASDETLRQLLTNAGAGLPFTPAFLHSEWRDVVDAWQLKSWEEYKDVKRLGRKTRLREDQRAQVWKVFETVLGELQNRSLITSAEMFLEVAKSLPQRRRPPYDHVIVDEAQDVSIAQLRFLAALAGDRPNALFFAGDLGQRIFQQPFSWLSQGVDVRGRSRTLNINYRTSHQIRSQSDALLGEVVTDVDGVQEVRKGTVSVFNGPAPQIVLCSSAEDESETVAKWLQTLFSDGVKPHEIALFVRSVAELPRCETAATYAGLPFVTLDSDLQTQEGAVSVGTMHLAKGLEFKAVAVMACDDGVIPLQERLLQAADPADLEEIYSTERHLLYVACTRARDQLLVSSGGTPSEFLDDLRP